VTPRTEADLALQLQAVARIVIDTFFGAIDIGGKLFDLTKNIAHTEGSNWGEDMRMRFGTFTSAPGSQLTSHWPKAQGASAVTRFAALPQSVSACMADPQPTGDLAPPCTSVPGSYPAGVATTPPQVNVCVIAPVNLIDLDPQQYPADQCKALMQTFVRGGTGLQQTLFGKTVRSRILDPNDTSWSSALQTAVDGCARALGTATGVQSFITTGACDKNGRYYDPSSALTASTDNSAPASTDSPNTCRP
jgi:hypothetical protein